MQNMASDAARIDDLPADAAVPVEVVAKLLGCSTRHIWRLVDARHMPVPFSLGRLKRWRLGTLREWIRAGCPAPGKA